jgi:small subunit ribosomal protein S16
MSTTIRLTRIGKKHQPLYRVVVKTTRDKRDGKYIEELGFYNPNTNPATVTLKNERIDYWLKQGSLVSETVKNLLKKSKSK